MASLEEAQERFSRAMEGVERLLAQQQAQQRSAAQELSLLKARYAELETQYAALQKAYGALNKQHQLIAGRLDGAISGLHELLSA